MLWEYCAKRRTMIHSRTPRDIFQLNGNKPLVLNFGVQYDISNICQFQWHEWCYLREGGKAQFQFQKERIGRVLDPFNNEDNEMSQEVLKNNLKLAIHRICRYPKIDKGKSGSEQINRKELDYEIKRYHSDAIPIPEILSEEEDDTKLFDPEDNPRNDPIDTPEQDTLYSTGKAVYENPFMEMLIHDLVQPKTSPFSTRALI